MITLGFLLGDAGESGRDVIVCLQGQWLPNNVPLVCNLEWDPREESQVDFGHGRVIEN